MGAFFPTQDVLAKPIENYVWDSGTLSWVKETQPGAGPGGGLTNTELRAAPIDVNVSGGGDATAAKQDTGNASLSSIDTKLTSQATAAKQDTGNASLASIDTKLTNPLPVSGTVATGGLTDAQLRATAVPVSGSISETRPATSAVTTVAANAANVTLLASNASRRGAIFFNDSTSSVYIKFGATATTSSFTIKVFGAGFYEVVYPVYTGIIDGIWDVATGNMRITELT